MAFGSREEEFYFHYLKGHMKKKVPDSCCTVGEDGAYSNQDGCQGTRSKLFKPWPPETNDNLPLYKSVR